jgi:hypothetical protein
MENRSQPLRFTPQEIDEWRLERDIAAIFQDPRKQLFVHHSILVNPPVPFARAGTHTIVGSPDGTMKVAHLKLH